ncbi:hypothetical protein H0S70_06445 [Chryseobacterium manosquense]|uniref:Uncharacterized protein n=1 Tax=Chryseobacterium manosquense TaxID=2754694 RepID=A0A7H1E026_9FLAO|nr:hypothetical protein [Chryseobacterium manosquense]QNS42584.1 hypothetical protein H0S70_06445 [Chryseobacterium manosquense]
MTTDKKFIEKLLKNVEDQNEGILIPNEIELEISKIENFDYEIAKELTLINENIFTEKRGINNDVFSENKYSVPLITFANDNKTIKFYPIALKKYLTKII